MKKCFFCAEEIQDEAIKCKHCGEFLDGHIRATSSMPEGTPKPDLPWYFKNGAIIMALLTVGPLALPLVWRHPRYSFKTKIIYTIICLVITYFAFVTTVKTIASVKAMLQELQTLGM